MSEPEDSLTIISKEYIDKVGCDVRRFNLVIRGQSKTIVHYHFTKWPDFGKPENADRQALIELSKQSYIDAGASPRVVHCSAGVGRTGTWIALDFLIRELEAGHLLDHPANESIATTQNSTSPNPIAETWGKSGPPKVQTPTLENTPEKEDLDLIFEVVNTLREQRMMMVIKEVQYQFLYEAVKDAFIEKYDAAPHGPVISKTATMERRISSRGPKARRVSGDEAHADDSVSDADTDILPPDNSVLENADPYAITSGGDTLR